MRRKILMGVFALALPVGTLAGLTTAASAKTGPPDPSRSCTVAGSVTFQAPGLSAAGDVSPTLKVSTTHATASLGGGCSGPSITEAINSKNTKCKGVNNPSAPCEAKHTYAYDTESNFASPTTITSITKSLKKLSLNVDGVTYSTKTTGAAEISCSGGEVGFQINGTVKGPKNDKGETSVLSVCLGADSGPGTSGDFIVDLGTGTGTITGAAIDGSNSTLTIG